MKKITSSLVLLSAFGFAGGTIGQLEMNLPIVENEILEANTQVIVQEPVVQPPVVQPPVVQPPVLQPPVVQEDKKEPMAIVVPTPKFYIGASVALAEIDTETTTEIVNNAHPIAAIVKVGYNIMDNLAIEARAGRGIKKDTLSSISENQINSMVAAYVKPNINVSDNINLFGLVGYAKTKMEQSTFFTDVSGISYGAGLSYSMTPSLSIVGDIIRYGKVNAHRVDASSLGLQYAF